MPLQQPACSQPFTRPAVPEATARLIPFRQLQPSDLVAWRKLEQESLDGNPFISPDFVASALQHLVPNCCPQVLLIERGTQLIGVGVFESVHSSRSLPLPHLRSWSTAYTFLDGMLLHRDAAGTAAAALWRYLILGPHPWHGIEFSKSAQNSRTMNLLAESSRGLPVSHWQGPGRQRAILRPSLDGERDFMATVSVKRAKSLRKGWRELEKRGTVAFELIGTDRETDPEALAAATEHLLRLEGMGWKADCGSALKSNPQHATFMRDLAASLAARGQLFFSQIRVDGDVIASVVHLISGKQAFAFKLGWDPAWERGCPGFQLKARIACDASHQLLGIDSIDSCASEGSFIDHVWGDRQPIGANVFAASIPGRAALSVTQSLRWIKRRLLHNRLEAGH